MITSLLKSKLTLDDWPDIKLNLIDQTETIEVKAHRHILANCSDFFRSMFIFNKSTTIFEMKVDNAQIMYLVIKSMYGIIEEVDCPQWYWTLEIIKCYRYLQIDIDIISKLATIQIPTEGMVMLFDVVKQFDLWSNKYIIHCLRQNSFDNITDCPIEWTKFISTGKIITLNSKNIFKIYDIFGEVKEFETEYYHPCCFDISKDRRFLVYGYISTGTDRFYTRIFDIKNHVNYKLSDVYRFQHITISPCNKKIVVVAIKNPKYIVYILKITGLTDLPINNPKCTHTEQILELDQCPIIVKFFADGKIFIGTNHNMYIFDDSILQNQIIEPEVKFTNFDVSLDSSKILGIFENCIWQWCDGFAPIIWKHTTNILKIKFVLTGYILLDDTNQIILYDGLCYSTLSEKNNRITDMQVKNNLIIITESDRISIFDIVSKTLIHQIETSSFSERKTSFL